MERNEPLFQNIQQKKTELQVEDGKNKIEIEKRNYATFCPENHYCCL